MGSLSLKIKKIQSRLRSILINSLYIVYWDICPRLKRRISSRFFSGSSKKNVEIKIAITILTYKRYSFFKKTLESFIKLNKAHLKQFLIIILVQGDKDEDIEKVINKYKNQIYNVIRPGVNLGCAMGYSILMKEALKLNLPYIIHLEDDFLSNESLSNYLHELIRLMEERNDVGCVRLRSLKDNVNDYNVISKNKIKYKEVIGNIAIGNAHFTFNPTIVKSSVIKKIIPTTSEKNAMQKYQKMGLKTGQLLAECFSHIGNERVKDWIE